MEIRDMPGCCGIKLITNFGHTHANEADLGGNYKPSNEEVSTYLLTIARTYPSRALICFINGDQNKVLEKTILEAGFERTFEFYHRNHNSTIYQYTKSPKLIKND